MTTNVQDRIAQITHALDIIEEELMFLEQYSDDKDVAMYARYATAALGTTSSSFYDLFECARGLNVNKS